MLSELVISRVGTAF